MRILEGNYLLDPMEDGELPALKHDQHHQPEDEAGQQVDDIHRDARKEKCFLFPLNLIIRCTPVHFVFAYLVEQNKRVKCGRLDDEDEHKEENGKKMRAVPVTAEATVLGTRRRRG